MTHQCTCPAEADFVFVHVGDRSKKDVRVLFKMRGARADSPVDAEEKEIQIAFSDGAMRSRKSRNKGNYSVLSTMLGYSEVVLSSTLPDRTDSILSTAPGTPPEFPGLVKALQPSDLWHLPRLAASVHQT